MFARLLDIDHLVRAWIVAHRVHALDAVMLALSSAGRGGRIWLAIGAVLTISRRITGQRLAEIAAALLVASALADDVLKPMIGRQRPFLSIPSVSVIGSLPDGEAFPSGHVANAFAGATVLARAVPAWQPLWWALAVLISFSRVYLGVHYPADVVGGAIVGALSAIAVLLASAAFTRSGVKGT